MSRTKMFKQKILLYDICLCFLNSVRKFGDIFIYIPCKKILRIYSSTIRIVYYLPDHECIYRKITTCLQSFDPITGWTMSIGALCNRKYRR